VWFYANTFAYLQNLSVTTIFKTLGKQTSLEQVVE